MGNSGFGRNIMEKMKVLKGFTGLDSGDQCGEGT